MTITDATHALATQGRRSASSMSPALESGTSDRLVDLIARVEPTWVEAVAVVQAVCAQLKPGEAAPPLHAIAISSSGAVSFPAPREGDEVTTVTAVGQLLSGILRGGDCPLKVLEAAERALRAPATVGDARAFGAALTSLPPANGPRELAAFVKAARHVEPAGPSGQQFRQRADAWARAFVVLMALAGV